MRTSWLGCRDRGVLGLLPSRSYRSKNNSIIDDQTYRLLFVTCNIAREITLFVDRSIIRHLLPSDLLYLFLSLSSFLLSLARACVFMFACACRTCARVFVSTSCAYNTFTFVHTCVFTSRVRIYLHLCACVYQLICVCVQMCIRVCWDSCASRACRHLYCQCCRPAGAPPAQWTREHFRLSARSSSRRLLSTASLDFLVSSHRKSCGDSSRSSLGAARASPRSYSVAMFTCHPPRRPVFRRSLCFSNCPTPCYVTGKRFRSNSNSSCWTAPFITSPRRPSRINGRRPPAIQSVYTISPFVRFLCSQTCLRHYNSDIEFLLCANS